MLQAEEPLPAISLTIGAVVPASEVELYVEKLDNSMASGEFVSKLKSLAPEGTIFPGPLVVGGIDSATALDDHVMETLTCATTLNAGIPPPPPPPPPPPSPPGPRRSRCRPA